jgi:hypothetical protein
LNPADATDAVFNLRNQLQQPGTDLVLHHHCFAVADEALPNLSADIFKPPRLVQHFVQFGRIFQQNTEFFQRGGQFILADQVADFGKESWVRHDRMVCNWSKSIKIVLCIYWFLLELFTQHRSDMVFDFRNRDRV